MTGHDDSGDRRRASDVMLRRRAPDYLAAPKRLPLQVPRDLLVERIKPDVNPCQWWLYVYLAVQMIVALVWFALRFAFGRWPYRRKVPSC